MVTVISHVSVFPSILTEHISAVKFLMGYEQNMSFLFYFFSQIMALHVDVVLEICTVLQFKGSQLDAFSP